MLEFRLKSFETFKKMPMQTWGADLSEIDFDDLIYYQNLRINLPVHGTKFQRKSRKPLSVSGFLKRNVLYLAGASAQYESEVVYHNMKEEFESWGLSLPIRILP